MIRGCDHDERATNTTCSTVSFDWWVDQLSFILSPPEPMHIIASMMLKRHHTVIHLTLLQLRLWGMREIIGQCCWFAQAGWWCTYIPMWHMWSSNLFYAILYIWQMKCQWMKNRLNKVWDKVVTNLLMLKGHTCHRFATWIWAKMNFTLARFRTAVYKTPQTAKQSNKHCPVDALGRHTSPLK